MPILHNHPILKPRRVDLRKNQTPQEVLLWARLRSKQLGFKFKRQHSIGPYILDFYCPKKRLAIEIDGGQHNETINLKKDNVRSEYLKHQDVKVIRF